MTGLETRVIIGQLLDLYESEEELSVFAEHERVAPLAHGWYMAVRRLGLAIIQLVDSGFEFEAASLKRSLIEHVVALRWLIHATDDAVTSLLRAHQRSVGKLQSAVAAAAWPIASDDAFNVILGMEPGSSSEDRNLHFKQRCEEYGTEDLYSAWLVETVVSHPSFSTARAYSTADQDGKLQLTDHASGDGALATVAWALVVASETFNQLIVDRPWTDELAEIGSRLVELIKASGLR